MEPWIHVLQWKKGKERAVYRNKFLIPTTDSLGSNQIVANEDVVILGTRKGTSNQVWILVYTFDGNKLIEKMLHLDDGVQLALLENYLFMRAIGLFTNTC
jgi:hypothetical protein